MKKGFVWALALTFLIVLSGCAAKPAAGGTDGEGLTVIAANFPAYDFARQVCGADADVTMLLPAGSESHSYEPTPQDIIALSECDLFVYGGGESDAWVDDVLASMDEPVATLKMMDCVDAVEEELTEGMEEEHDHDEGEDGEEEPEYDEHVWTAPQNAVLIAQAIAQKAAALDGDGAQGYTDRCEAYVAELTALDQDFTDFFATVENKTMVFGDRFPLRYFADAYGLDCYAAFPGCSTETEASAATVAFLIDKVKDEGLSTVFYIELSTHPIADTIAESAGAQTALFHSCHNVTAQEFESGVTYLSLMRQNLETLKGAMK